MVFSAESLLEIDKTTMLVGLVPNGLEPFFVRETFDTIWVDALSLKGEIHISSRTLRVGACSERWVPFLTNRYETLIAFALPLGHSTLRSPISDSISGGLVVPAWWWWVFL